MCWCTSPALCSALPTTLAQHYRTAPQVIVERNFDIANQQAQRPTYMLYAWGLPVLFALLPFSTNNYGNNGAWCSITSSSGSWWGGVLWHAVCLYGPCWAAIAYNITMYLRVHQFVRGMHSVGRAGARGGACGARGGSWPLPFAYLLTWYTCLLPPIPRIPPIPLITSILQACR